MPPCGTNAKSRDVRFSNRPFGVKRFETIHQHSVDVAHGLVLLFGIGAKALPSLRCVSSIRRPSCPSDVLTVLCRFHWRLRSLRHSLEYIIGSDTTQTPAQRWDRRVDGLRGGRCAVGISLPFSAARRCSRCGRRRGGALSDPADPAHRAVPRGRRHRHRRPRARPEAAREPGPASRDRQSRRRRRHARHGARRQGCAGRLHAAAGADQPRHQSEHLCEAALRHREGFRADHDGRFRRDPDGGESARARRHDARLRRGRQGPARRRSPTTARPAPAPCSI